MKPRNKREAAIVARFEKLGLTGSDMVPENLRKWVLRSVIRPQALASGRKAWCSECGEPFAYDLKTSRRYVVCPHCGRRLVVRQSRAFNWHDTEYVQQLDTDGEYQIVRMYQVKYMSRRGEPSRTNIYHVYELWFDETQQRRYRFTVNTSYNPYSNDPFGCGSLGLAREFYNSYMSGWYISGVYPMTKVQPWLVKYDIRAPFGKYDLFDVIDDMMRLKDTQVETVWKLRHWAPELSEFYLKHLTSSRYFRQICIAHRHGYRVRRPRLWFDYLQMLEFEDMDINNPAIILPDDLAAAHDRLVERRTKRTEIQARRREEERRLKEEEERMMRENSESPDNVRYRKRIGAALDETVCRGIWTVAVLHDIQDFFEQGKALHQCVFSAKYYQREDVLLLNIREGGKRKYTAEIYVKNGRIGQLRGVCNKEAPSELRDFINDCKGCFLSKLPDEIRNKGIWQN